MFIFLWLVLCLAAASMLLLPLLLWRREILNRYSGGRLVACPENQQSAVVRIDALRAASTGIDGIPDLRLCDCTRWPERANCNQACLSKAVQAGAYKPGEIKGRTKQIYHLPIFLAAFAAWYLGLIWHSHYLFRDRWVDAVGLTRVQVHQMLGWYWLHLFTIAICLLFAYGVAGALVLSHRKGVLQGILMSLLLCGTVVATGMYGTTKLPHDLFILEAGYIILAATAVGAIVGGLFDKLVLRSQ